MQNVPVKPFIFGIIFSSIFWGLLAFAFNFETKIPQSREWESRFEVYETAVTENRRLFDRETGRTILWSPGNPKTNVIDIKELSPGRWQATLEKVY